MREDNIFRFGGWVSGESFFGRKQIYRDIVKDTRKTSGFQAISIVGLNRVGKTSLIHRLVDLEFEGKPDTIVASVDVQSSSKANSFWYTLIQTVEQKLHAHGIHDPDIEQQLNQIDSMSIDDSRWFPRMSMGLQFIMERLKVMGYRVILILDEFDRCRDIFKEEPGGLGVIRNLAAGSNMATTVITISRRRLYMIEEQLSKATSNLERVFYTRYMMPFDNNDMECYWDALAEYYIFPNEEMQCRLIELAGHQPYLLCLYANRLAEKAMAGERVSADTLNQIHDKEYASNIQGYYSTLYERMRDDGYAAKLRCILFQVMYGVRADDVNLFKGCGYLSEDENGYYILSKEFTDYFVEQSKELYLPAWDAIMAAERTLKNMVRKVYPKLDSFRFSELKNDAQWFDRVTRTYPDIRLHEGTILANMRQGPEYGQDPTITDVLTLKYIVTGVIKPNWEKFRRYFNGKDYYEWERQLELLIRARTPLAHDHADYLNEHEENLLLIYCSQIIDLAGA